MKLGFIDYYLDEWHANNYPAWIAEQSAALGLSMELAYAWADTERGRSTESWCEAYGVTPARSAGELIEACDGILVLSPDNPEQHERLAAEALASGKRVYVDKTFSPDLAAGQRLFARAEQYRTPMFSSSALRFARELEGFQAGIEARPLFCATRGPGVFDNYAIHQLEMIDTVMGQGALRVKARSAGMGNALWIEYPQGLATMTQLPSAEFALDLAYEDGGRAIKGCTATFDNLIRAMLRFFAGEEAPVSKAATLHVMALREAGLAALRRPDVWVKVKPQ